MFFIGEFLIAHIFISFLIIFFFTSCSTKRIITIIPTPTTISPQKITPKSYSVIINSNSQINSITNLQLRNLYLRKNKFLNKQKIIPVNLLANNEARKAFESSILKTDRVSLNQYWIKQHLKDIKPPISQESYEAVLNFVINVDGAIGYIPSSIKDDRIKIINEF